jgi:phosphatidylserine/phosphatidylglycerophosphate/cardiolipin synthase-like enzyme
MDYNQYRSQYRNSGKSFINLRQKVGFVKLVRKANGGLNHHKVVFTDDENLILGSMNYSSAAVTSNDENFLLIKNAGAMIAEFKQEQRRIDEQSFLLPPVEDNGSYIPDPGD